MFSHDGLLCYNNYRSNLIHRFCIKQVTKNPKKLEGDHNGQERKRVKQVSKSYTQA